MKPRKQAKPPELCAVCGGTMRPSIGRLEEWHGDTLYVFENVPVLRCDECGEIWLEGSIVEKLDKLIERTTPTRTIEAPVYDLATV